jgi:hypothetical protein
MPCNSIYVGGLARRIRVQGWPQLPSPTRIETLSEKLLKNKKGWGVTQVERVPA